MMIFRTGPSGACTTGRCAVRCAAAGAVRAAAMAVMLSQVPSLANLLSLNDVQWAGTRTDAVPFNSIQVQDSQQEIGCPLHIVREHDVPVPLERTVNSA